jgi:hypothetical protein
VFSRCLTAVVVVIAVVVLGPGPAPLQPSLRAATTATPMTASGGGRVVIEREHDPETQAPGIQITYRWDPEFGRRYDARVRLLQDGRLVGRITFLRGWSDAPAFFRTKSAPARHSFRAVGVLLRRSGAVVAGSTERSRGVRWRRTVEPGQITPTG